MFIEKKLENLNRDELVHAVRRLLAEADALSSRIAAVNEIGVAVNQTLDLDTILKVVAGQSKWLLDYEHLSVCLHQDKQWKLIVLFGESPDEDAIDPESTDNVGAVLKSGHPLLLRQGTASPLLAQYQSQIIIPLISGQERLGTINFAASAPAHYTQDDMRIGYMLSLQLSAAIRNANVVRELQATQEELHLRIEELDAYNHTIAHDLKSPLSSISLSSEIIKKYLPPDVPQKVRDFVDSIRVSTKQMNRMIDQLLLLAKLRHLDTAPEAVDINRVVQEALGRFSTMIAARNVSVQVQADLPDGMGYDQWIEEVFANLISNAIKYIGDDNPAPSIWIAARREGDVVRYEVRDNGIGIKPEDMAHLFEMFSRVEGTGAEGLGLGLSIVRRIIHRLRGQLGVESSLGAGSSFWFTLRCAHADPALKTQTSENTIIPQQR